MVNVNKLKQFIRNCVKRLYYALTTRSEDTLYYSNIYINNNREKMKKQPFKFVSMLIKINWLAYRNQITTLQTMFISDDNGIENFVKRPKVFRFAEQFILYQVMIIDLENSLFVTTKTKKEIFRETENALGIRNFAQCRQKYDSRTKSIERIYQEISNELGYTISYVKECDIYCNAIIVNRYISKALQVILYNGITCIGYMETCYPKELYYSLLKQYGNEKIGCNEMRLVTTYNELVTSDCLTNKHCGELVTMVTNYSKLRRLCQKLNAKVIYYRSTSSYVNTILLQYLTTDVSKEELERIALYLFDGMLPFNYQYVVNFLRKAPMFFHVLERVRKRALKLDCTIVILGDKESKLEGIYAKFFEAYRTVLWSPLASEEPKTVKQWDCIITEYPRLNTIPVERIMYALGHGTMLDGQDTMKTMVEKLITRRQPRHKEEIIHYLDEACGDLESVLIWNPTNCKLMTESFVLNLRCCNKQSNIYVVDDMNEIETQIMNEIIDEMEKFLPVLVGIFFENYAFALPEVRRDNENSVEKIILDYYMVMYENEEGVNR